MNNILKKTVILMMLGVPMVFLSCSKSSENEDVNQDDLKNKYVCVVIPRAGTASTYAAIEAGTNNENKVERIRVELIKNDGSCLWAKNYASSEFTLTNPGTNPNPSGTTGVPKYDADITNLSLDDVDLDILEKTKYVRVFCNVPTTEYPTTDPNLLKTLPSAAITSEIALPNAATPSLIPMSGFKDVATAFSGGTYSTTVEVSRNYAKLRFSLVVDASAPSITVDYTNVKVEVVDVPNKAPYYSWYNTSSITYPTLASLTSAGISFIDYAQRNARLSTTVVSSLRTGAMVDSCYINPQNRTDADYTANGKKTILKVTVPTSHSGVNKTNVYKIPIFTNGTYDILPNHIYTLKLSVLGDGVNDINVQLVVCPWEVEETHEPVGAGLTIDPVKYLKINTETNPWTSGSVSIAFSSNVDVSVFKVVGFLNDNDIPAGTSNGTVSFTANALTPADIEDDHGKLAPSTVLLRAGTSFATCLVYPMVEKVFVTDPSLRSVFKNDYPSLMDGDSLIIYKARAYTGALNLNNKNIANIDQIQYFNKITTLNARNNNFSSIDLSHCTELKNVYVSVNDNLSTINVQGCTKLENLTMDSTAVTSINADNLPALIYFNAVNCTELQTATFGGTTFTSSTPSAYIKLTEAQLTGLQIVNKPALYSVDISNDKSFTGLIPSQFDIKNCINLKYLTIHSLNLDHYTFTTFPELTLFEFQDEKYQGNTIDFSNLYPKLEKVIFDVWNQNQFYFSNHPTLKVAIFNNYYTEGKTQVTGTYDFSGCNHLIAVSIVASTFQDVAILNNLPNLQRIGGECFYFDGTDNDMIDGSNSLKKYDQGFCYCNIDPADILTLPALTTYSCINRFSNSYTLDFGNCPNLYYVDLAYSSAAQVDLSSNSNLKLLRSGRNGRSASLTTLNLGNNKSQLEVLMMRSCPNLTNFIKPTESTLTKIKYFDISGSKLPSGTQIDLSSCTLLDDSNSTMGVYVGNQAAGAVVNLRLPSTVTSWSATWGGDSNNTNVTLY